MYKYPYVIFQDMADFYLMAKMKKKFEKIAHAYHFH